MKISVLMAVYNESDYIEAAVDSVVSQDVDADLEVVCVDDFSVDDTWVKLEGLARKNDNVKVFRNQVKGKCSAFNLAFEQSGGDLLLLLGGDDLLPSGALQKRTEPWRVFGLSHDVEYVTACKYKTFSTNKRLDGMVLPRLNNKGALSGGTVVFTRKLGERMFPIPTGLVSEDLWMRCHFEYLDGIKIFDVSGLGLLYRLHEKNSLRRDVDYLTKNFDICRRSVVYGMFLESYRQILSPGSRDLLEKLVALEVLRARGCSMSLAFFKGVGFIDRLRAVVYSKAFLYWIHKKLIRISTGYSR